MKITILYIFLLPLLALGCQAQGTGPTVAYGKNPAAGKYYPVRGFSMYCESYGAGRPLLMIHGNGGSIEAFTSNIPYFSQRYRVIVADSRAHGRSADTGDSLGFEMMADDYAALLDVMKIDSCYVIGWSDGGIIALLLAMRHPGKVISLASTGANIWPDSTAIVPALWKDEKKEYEAGKNKTNRTTAQKNDWKIFMLDWEQPNLALSDLHAIRCPSLIIAGDHDVITGEHTLKIFENIRGAQLWILPHSGHATLIEHRDEFNKKVDDFFMKR